MAFTIRYMARKNLIQFWVSSHFSDSVCFQPLPRSHYVIIIIAISVLGWMHLYSSEATFTEKKEQNPIIPLPGFVGGDFKIENFE